MDSTTQIAAQNQYPSRMVNVFLLQEPPSARNRGSKFGFEQKNIEFTNRLQQLLFYLTKDLDIVPTSRLVKETRRGWLVNFFLQYRTSFNTGSGSRICQE